MNAVHVANPGSLLDVEVRHLRLLVALSETRSITMAGRVLHLTQSALSHQLSDLETRINAQLFARTRSGLVPTPTGRHMVQAAYDVLSRLSKAQTELAGRAKNGCGTLRVTTECHTCYRWLPSVLKPLAAQYPGVELFIDVNATLRPLDALAEQDVDLALMYSHVKRGPFVARPLFHDEWVAVLAPQHPLAGRPFLRAEDFAQETGIFYTAPRRDMFVFRKFFNPARVQPRRALHVQLTEAMVEMAKANLGIAVLTRWSVESELQSGTLVALPLDRRGLHRTWHAVYRKQKGTPVYLQEFVRLLKAAFPAGPSMQSARPGM